MLVMFGELIILILLVTQVKLEASTGVGLEWFSPIGPFTFTLAQPISKIDTDKTQSFQFNIGTTF